MKYKLNIGRDVDISGDYLGNTDYILNTPAGFRINDSDICHVRGFDSLAELRDYVKQGGVVPCNCEGCTK
jgi:hypothetical protein